MNQFVLQLRYDGSLLIAIDTIWILCLIRGLCFGLCAVA